MANERPDYWEPFGETTGAGLRGTSTRIESRIASLRARRRDLEPAAAGDTGQAAVPQTVRETLGALRTEEEALEQQLRHIRALLAGHSPAPRSLLSRWSTTGVALLVSGLLFLLGFVLPPPATADALFGDEMLLGLLAFAVALAAYFAQVNQATKEALGKERDESRKPVHASDIKWVSGVEQLDVVFGLVVANRIVAPYLPPEWALIEISTSRFDVLLLLFLVTVVVAAAVLHARQVWLWNTGRR